LEKIFCTKIKNLGKNLKKIKNSFVVTIQDGITLADVRKPTIKSEAPSWMVIIGQMYVLCI
jgi:hypothetical protein